MIGIRLNLIDKTLEKIDPRAGTLIVSPNKYGGDEGEFYELADCEN